MQSFSNCLLDVEAALSSANDFMGVQRMLLRFAPSGPLAFIQFRENIQNMFCLETIQNVAYVDALWDLFIRYKYCHLLQELIIDIPSFMGLDHHSLLTDTRVQSLMAANVRFTSLEILKCSFEIFVDLDTIRRFLELMPEAKLKKVTIGWQNGLAEGYDIDAAFKRMISPFATDIRITSQFVLKDSTLHSMLENPHLKRFIYLGHIITEDVDLFVFKLLKLPSLVIAKLRVRRTFNVKKIPPEFFMNSSTRYYEDWKTLEFKRMTN
jgi:hypothetical protein